MPEPEKEVKKHYPGKPPDMTQEEWDRRVEEEKKNQSVQNVVKGGLSKFAPFMVPPKSIKEYLAQAKAWYQLLADERYISDEQAEQSYSALVEAVTTSVYNQTQGGKAILTDEQFAEEVLPTLPLYDIMSRSDIYKQSMLDEAKQTRDTALKQAEAERALAASEAKETQRQQLVSQGKLGEVLASQQQDAMNALLGFTPIEPGKPEAGYIPTAQAQQLVADRERRKQMQLSNAADIANQALRERQAQQAVAGAWTDPEIAQAVADQLSQPGREPYARLPPPSSAVYRSFAGTLASPALQQFAQQSMGSVLSRFNPQARVEWAKALNYGGAGTEGTRSPDVREDPLLSHLKQYPFAQEFIRLPPAQRGVYSGRLSPRARWFSG